LGPTAFGKIPGFRDFLFPVRSLDIINVVAQIGIIFFMFIIGAEIDPKYFKNKIKAGLIIAVASILAPFLLSVNLM
jgi:Kef-type K+ transport system membrane component KefB